MMPFDHLDSLLRKEFETFNTKNNTQRDINPFYLSTADISRKLNEASAPILNLPAMEHLVKKLQLDEFEKNVITIIFAPEIDPKYEKIYAYLQDDMNKTYPTVHLIASLLSDDEREKKEILNYFISDSKLMMLNLVTFIGLAHHTSTFQQPLRAAESLRNFLLEHFQPDSTLAPFCKLLPPAASVDDCREYTEAIRQGGKEHKRYIVNLVGKSSSQKRERAAALASAFGFGLSIVSCSLIPQTHETVPLLNALLRDALLGGTLLYFEDFDKFIDKRKTDEPLLFDRLSQLSWLSFFSTAKRWNPDTIPSEPQFITMELKPENEYLLQKRWEGALNEFGSELALSISPALSRLFRFTPDEIDDIYKLLRSKTFLYETVDEKTVIRACRSRLTNELDTYAQHLVSDNTLEDIILPPDHKAQLHEIIIHYNHQIKVFEEWGFKQHFQSRGIGVLFAGASGTGKTMTASILANTLGLELYRIELSKIVSKYIGETEKNLSNIFAAAEESGIVLFFDEADAIFGKRTEIKDSHDRYANIEVSYLLQRIEAYNGIVILASNFRNNIDDAFVRRMRFIIDFPLPNEIQREAIWRKIFDKKVVAKEIDFAFLGKTFKLSGANIRNAALYAAFNAAESFEIVNVDHIYKGVKRELQKIGKPFKERDLEGYNQGD